MPESITFDIPGAAVGKGRPRAVRTKKGVRMHTPEGTVNYEALVKMCAAQAMTGRTKFDGPVILDLTIHCDIPGSWSAKRQREAEAGEILPTTKPDLDNVAKAIADACNGIVYGDDKQVVRLYVEKQYSRTPGASVVVTGIENARQLRGGA